MMHNVFLLLLRNFPTGTQMDENFANMRNLIQVLDQTLYDAIQQSGDFSHFYFCYRYKCILFLKSMINLCPLYT